MTLDLDHEQTGGHCDEQVHLPDVAGRRGEREGRPGPVGLGVRHEIADVVQGVLDDYEQGAIDEAAFLSRSGWEDRWGYDYALYRPMVNVARDRKMDLLALNAPQELTKKVAHHGLQGLSQK